MIRFVFALLLFALPVQAQTALQIVEAWHGIPDPSAAYAAASSAASAEDAAYAAAVANPTPATYAAAEAAAQAAKEAYTFAAFAAQGATQLPSSTGQIAYTMADCQQIVANNLSAAPGLGYTVDSQAGTFYDPVTNITVKQSCLDNSAGAHIYPAHPFDQTTPPAQTALTPVLGEWVGGALSFDGTDDYLTRDADLTGATDSQSGIVSVAFTMADTSGAAMRVFSGAAGRFTLTVNTTGYATIFGRNAAGTVILYLQSTVAVDDGNSHHVMASWNLSTQTAHLYVDGTEALAGNAILTNDTIDYTDGDFAVGAYPTGANKMTGTIESIYVNEGVYLDLSQSANRVKFYDNGPADLGADGSTPTGSSPILYMTGVTNAGTGGAFTAHGNPGSGYYSEAETAKIIVWGQSHCANSINGRYVPDIPDGFSESVPPFYAYANGSFYRLRDPVAGSRDSTTDGNTLSRLGEAVLGRPIGSSTIKRVVIRGFCAGGTSINDWTTGGFLNSELITQLQDFVTNVGMPNGLYFEQGDADAGMGTMPTQEWLDKFNAMIASIRSVIPTVANGGPPITVAETTMCNARDATVAYNATILNRGPDYYINNEKGRMQIRAAQEMAGAQEGFQPGANTDQIVNYLTRSSEGDGCHWGPTDAAAVAAEMAERLYP